MRFGLVALLLVAMSIGHVEAATKKSTAAIPRSVQASDRHHNACAGSCLGQDKPRKSFSDQDRFESVPVRPSWSSGGFGG
jgi:hypothetical protein